MKNSVFVKAILTFVLCAMTALIVWLKFAPTDLEKVRADHLPLILALNAHKEKTGHYPKKIEELKISTPQFDPSPFAGYDRSDECVSSPCYELKKNGRYSIGIYVGLDIWCWFQSDEDIDFKCQD